ncbi:MAG TPA: DUF1707 domain-containing protein [Actinoallomurus sp.]|nr:DUF1707 domain-containing protein [Actinoallomurus sp.]
MNTEQLRVGDAERDEVTTALHEHFAQGRLTRDELDERLTATLSATTVGDLRAVTRDLPGGAPVPASGRHPAGPWGRGPWEMGAAYRGRGPLSSPWPRHGWGRPRPFAPLLLVALVAAAFTGWWVILPLLACAWFAAAFTGLRHARRRHASFNVRR